MKDVSGGAWLVYLLLCGDGTYYCGATNGLERRIMLHNKGAASRYTRGRGPVTLVTASRPLAKGEALSLEARVKKARREAKPGLILNY